MLPQSYPNYKTVHRRFQTWCRDEVLRRVLTDVAGRDLQAATRSLGMRFHVLFASTESEINAALRGHRPRQN
jgi:transposase